VIRSSGRAVRAWMLAAIVLSSGCGTSLVPVRIVARTEGYAISFPGSPTTVTGRDGPVDYRIDAMRTNDQTRYEVAWFRFPQELDPEERAELLRRVERGLAAPGARVASRVELPPGNKDRVDLVLDFQDGRRGYYRVLYPTAKAMLQVSVVGEKGGEWQEVASRFLGSLDVRLQLPQIAPPVSASSR
jgi:hypothetical protein